ADEVDDLLASLLDRGLEQRDHGGRGGGEADREHDPVDETVAALLATQPLRPVEEPEPERIEHRSPPFRSVTRCGQGSGESRRRAAAPAPQAAAPAVR